MSSKPPVAVFPPHQDAKDRPSSDSITFQAKVLHHAIESSSSAVPLNFPTQAPEPAVMPHPIMFAPSASVVHKSDADAHLHRTRGNKLSPLPWTKFFDKRRHIKTNRGSFCIYELGEGTTAFILLHGGGMSALSFAMFARELCARDTSARVIAIDFRGHGQTIALPQDDLSKETLCNDVVSVLDVLLNLPSSADVEPIDCDAVYLVGHSMGGAIAVHLASMDVVPKFAGLVVVDVVEGTAMDSLPAMEGFLKTRPKRFRSVEEVVDWTLHTGQLRSRMSARVSVPDQVVPVEPPSADATTPALSATGDGPMDATASVPVAKDDGTTPSVYGHVGAACDGTTPQETSRAIGHDQDSCHKDASHVPRTTALSTIGAVSPHHVEYTWRVDLQRSEQYWHGWFHGMSAAFLTVTVPKLLILAGITTLDVDLTVGQMQGKFQMQVLQGVGHCVHEDSPAQVAELLKTFTARNRASKVPVVLK
eukprot:m.59129 g.59129  ORF g.59129 m.59129 type:complete len:477 (+) comp15675_c0_seq1:514-1944(+)